MDKLSSILPSSSRVTSVDLDEAPPARPGSPTFGRKVGVNSVKDRVTLSQNAKDIAAKDNSREKEALRTKSVEEINRKFFDTRLTPTEMRPVSAVAPVSEQISSREMEMEEEVPAKEQQMISQYENKEPAPSRLSIEA